MARGTKTLRGAAAAARPLQDRDAARHHMAAHRVAGDEPGAGAGHGAAAARAALPWAAALRGAGPCLRRLLLRAAVRRQLHQQLLRRPLDGHVSRATGEG